MRSSMRRFGYAGLLAGVAAVALTSSAYSATLTGSVNNVGAPPPIEGTENVFGITGATATINTVADTLTLTINTWFAGEAGVGGTGAPSYGTGYGSLFLQVGGTEYAVTNPLTGLSTNSG